VLRSGTERVARVLKFVARGDSADAVLLDNCIAATQALANIRKNRPNFLQTIFTVLLSASVITRDEFLKWAKNDDPALDDVEGRGRAIGMLETFIEELEASA